MRSSRDFRHARRAAARSRCLHDIANEAFVARARGDLDGDGLLSTFEIRGGIAPADKAKLVPGMYVEAALE